MDHTENIVKPNKSLITSLLKAPAMFQLRKIYDKHNEEENVVDAIAIKCSYCNKDTCLYLKDTTIE